MKKHALMIATLAGMTLAGCQSVPKAEQGVLIGGAVGAAVGHNFGGGSGQVLATVAGAAVGAVVGNNLGRQLDDYDQLQAQYALEHHRTGEGLTWVNPDTAQEVAVTPTRTYQEASSGRYCREYTTAVVVGGGTEEAYGTACRQPDGSWKIVN